MTVGLGWGFLRRGTMKTTKNYKFGNNSFKTYIKKSRKGISVGLSSGKKIYFEGGFTTEKIAKKWWAYLNNFIPNFFNDHKFYADAPKDFYGQFMGTFVYREYYKFLTDLLETDTENYKDKYDTFVKKYQKFVTK
jgi:hypothetical protein